MRKEAAICSLPASYIFVYESHWNLIAYYLQLVATTNNSQSSVWRSYISATQIVIM